MNALELQDTVITELTALFADQLFQKPRDDVTAESDPVPLNITDQALPFRGDSFSEYMPYLVPQIMSGRQENESDPEDVTLLLNIGIFDDNVENKGHRTVMQMIEKIRLWAFKDRLHGEKYVVQLPFSWQLSEEDTWPYFFGSIETHWALPIILPEDPLT